VKDQNGNHVIQKAIEKVDQNVIEFIVDSFEGQIAGLAVHPYGCRVIQRLLEHCRPRQGNQVTAMLAQHHEKCVTTEYARQYITLYKKN
jgi:hypothetical protein